MNTLYPFLTFLPRKDPNRGVQPPQVRDMLAANELLMALLPLGFRYEEPILNYPPPTASRELLEENELHPVDLSFVGPEAYLLTATRPPIHDMDHGDRKRMEPGNTDVERRIFRAWQKYLAYCARSHVKLGRTARNALPEGFERCRDIAFRQSGGGFYKELNSLDGSGWQKQPAKGMTAAFLLRVEELPGGGPGLINSFGMDAVASLAWAYRLGRDFAYLLDKPGFSMVEIRRTPVPERPTNLRWAQDWKIEPLIENLV